MSAKKPLEGIKVIELGQLIAGPFAGKMFAEFGAEVIKIEAPAVDGQPGGDPLRQWRKLHNGTSLWWYAQARNKKSVTVNLRLAEGQEIARKLARDADIVIENFRPGTMEKWGLGYERLAAENPGLIMLRLSGFGQTGPIATRPDSARSASRWAGCAISPAIPTGLRCGRICPSAIRSPRCTASSGR